MELELAAPPLADEKNAFSKDAIDAAAQVFSFPNNCSTECLYCYQLQAKVAGYREVCGMLQDACKRQLKVAL